MLRIIETPKKSAKTKRVRITEGQIRSLTKAASQIIAVTVAERAEKVELLLKRFKAPLSESPKPQELISRIMDKLAQQDALFNIEFEALIIEVFPELGGQESFDNFGEAPFQFGSGARITSGSSGSNLLDGAKSIGGGAASGAASGGVAGGILGAIGGIFGFASSVKQQKIEKEKASAMTFASMLQYKAARLAKGGEGTRTMAKIIIAVIAVIGLVVGIMIYSKNKKAKKWADQVEVA